MKISEINIKNFKSVKEETIIFPSSGILMLVGPNNAGKSNILKAVNNILGESWFNKEKCEINDYYNKSFDNPISINIVFNDGKSVNLDLGGSQKWPEYKDVNGSKIGEWRSDLDRINSRGNVKEDFPCTFLPAERSLEKNLQFRSYELMGKIAKSFNEKAQGKKIEIEQKFGEVMDLLNDVDGFQQFKEDFVKFFDDMQADTPYKLKVDFKAFSPLNYFKTINILANDSSVNTDYDIDVDEFGEGNKSLLLFALLRSYAKNFKQDATGILAIEEPEIYLHPQARRHLFRIFFDIVNDSNIQIIYTTHSPDFVATECFDSIGSVSKTLQAGTLVKTVTKEGLVRFSIDTGVPEEKVSIDNISEFYATTSNYRLNEGFFAKCLFLVEGETEELCLPLLFDRLGIDSEMKGISFISVEGKNQIPKYWRLFYPFGIKTYVIFDNDDDSSGDKRRSNQNLANCFNCGIDEIVNMPDGETCKVISTYKAGVFDQKIISLNQDFENVVKCDYEAFCAGNQIDSKYEEYSTKAKELIKPTGNSQKGQIARYIIKEILKDNPQYKPKFLEKILTEINDPLIPLLEIRETLPDDGNVAMVRQEQASEEFPF